MICCRIDVVQATADMLPLLALAGFHPVEHLWIREIESEGTMVRARSQGIAGIEFSLSPSVTNWAGHAEKRLAASLMLQAAALLAERCGGKVTQCANVTECMKADGRASTEVIADYPEMPLLFPALCAGWQAVLMPGEGC